MKSNSLMPKTISSKIFIALAISCGLFILSLSSGLFAGQADAQAAPKFLVSWRAINYVPSDYQGLIFPSNASPVEISFDLIDNGKIANLSRNKIRWTLNGKFFNSQNGLKSIRYIDDGTEQSIEISVFSYKGVDLDKFVTIPSTRPKVIIDTNSPTRNMGLGKHQFNALPYFFNVNNLNELSFNWRINGKTIEGAVNNPESLFLDLSSEDIPAETRIAVSVTVQNLFDLLELASQSKNFIIK